MGIKSQLTTGPRPHFRGYVSLSIMTRFSFATIPWSQVAITAVVIRAIAVKQKFIQNVTTINGQL